MVKQSFKSNSEISLKIIFQQLLLPDYNSYANPYSPIKNCNFYFCYLIFSNCFKDETRVCEICFSTSMIPFDPMNKGKSFICENCKRLLIGNSYPQHLPTKAVSSFYSPSRSVSMKQRYLSYEP